MSDATTTVQTLIDAVAAFEAERDWHQFHAPKNLAMGIAVETGELLEHFLWLNLDESRDIRRDDAALAQVREEIADVLTYVLMLAQSLEIDLSDAFFAKMKRNAQKYPADKYRGKWKV